MSSTIKVGIIAAAIAAVGVAYNLAPATPVDPLTAALELCGDTPAPVEYSYQGRGVPELALEPPQQPYALAVKSVDDCRSKVLDHFKSKP